MLKECFKCKHIFQTKVEKSFVCSFCKEKTKKKRLQDKLVGKRQSQIMLKNGSKNYERF